MQVPTSIPESVLIVERDETVRRLLVAVLRQAGFRTRAVERIEFFRKRLERAKIDVIVADRYQPVAAAAPSMLPRTIIVTTLPELGEVFAVIRKPFDIAELSAAVAACARRGREHGDRAPRPVDLRTLEHFVDDIPRLRNVLTAQQPSQQELLLRSEIRRMVLRLSEAFRDVARQERGGARAAAFLAASLLAAELAGSPSPPVRVTAAGRDH